MQAATGGRHDVALHSAFSVRALPLGLSNLVGGSSSDKTKKQCRTKQKNEKHVTTKHITTIITLIGYSIQAKHKQRTHIPAVDPAGSNKTQVKFHGSEIKPNTDIMIKNEMHMNITN